ncbi:hypothetical protein WICPIJ_000965 [Wickerhamomyces pijperi]|uniref:Zn(2)-C6 fungal-type domain-containing protein n=1 Tax=Wickerhamomyces pijperi TaxID=599730 RepID=A0A9P8TR62_WICPI|nr:hypothetical protein WICPIJ_000965 [Wickerhamomyces pijperi]
MTKRGPTEGLLNGMNTFGFVNNEQHAAKRKRTITSCAPCRKKKVKCDKSRPVCGYCKKTKTGHQCEYPEPSWESSSVMVVSDYQKAASVPLAHINISATSAASIAAPNLKSELQDTSQHATMLNDTHTQPLPAAPPRRKSSVGLQTTFQVQQPVPVNVNSKSAAPAVSSIASNQPISLHPDMTPVSSGFNDYLFGTATPPQNTVPESNIRTSQQMQQPPLKKQSVPVRESTVPKTSLTFYSYTEPVVMRAGRLLAPGPLSLVSLLKKDPFLLVLLYKIRTDRLLDNFERKSRELQLKAVSATATASSATADKPADGNGAYSQRKNAGVASAPKSIYGLDQSLDNTASEKDLVQQIVFVTERVSGREEEFQKRLIENEQIEDINQDNLSDAKDNTTAAKGSTATLGNPDTTQATSSAKQDDTTSSKPALFPDVNLRVCASSDEYMKGTILYIYSILPSRKVIWTLFDRFFSCALIGAMPFSLQNQMKHRLVAVIGAPSYDEVGKVGLKLDKRFDFAYIGQLLYIMRISYLSVVKHDGNTEEEKFILQNPIGVEFANAAQMCLNQFKVLRRGAIPIAMCFLLMRAYHKYAPEDGDSSDGGDSQVFLGIAVQMMNSIGMNRDQSHVKQFASNIPFVNLMRLLWHEVVSMDVSQAMTYGSGTLTNPRFYDTKIPEMFDDSQIESSGKFDTQSRAAIFENYKNGDKLNKASRDILDLVLRIDQEPKISELLPKLSKLESTLAEIGCGSLKEILQLDISAIGDAIKKHHKFIKYVELKCSMFVIYYHIYANDPLNQGDCYKKLIEIALEIVPLALLLGSANGSEVNLFEKIFGTGTQLIIIPTLISCIHKLNQVFVSICCRCLDISFNYVTSPPRAKLVKRLFDIAIYYFRMSYDALKNLSSTYFQAWRAIKGTSYIYRMITNKNNNIWNRAVTVKEKGIAGDFNYYQHMPETNDIEQRTDAELEELIAILYNKEYFADICNRLSPFMKKSSQTVLNNIYGPGSTRRFKLMEFSTTVNLVFGLGKIKPEDTKFFSSRANNESINPATTSSSKKLVVTVEPNNPDTPTQTGNKDIDLMLNTAIPTVSASMAPPEPEPFRLPPQPQHIDNRSSQDCSRGDSGHGPLDENYYDLQHGGLYMDPEVDRLWINSIIGQNGVAATPGPSAYGPGDFGFTSNMFDLPSGAVNAANATATATATGANFEHNSINSTAFNSIGDNQPFTGRSDQTQLQQFTTNLHPIPVKQHDLYNEEKINLEISGAGQQVFVIQRNNRSLFAQPPPQQQQQQNQVQSSNLETISSKVEPVPVPRINDNLARFTGDLTSSEVHGLIKSTTDEPLTPAIGGDLSSGVPVAAGNMGIDFSQNQTTTLLGNNEQLNAVMDGDFDIGLLLNDLSTYGVFGL